METTNQKPETRNGLPAPLDLLDLCEQRFRVGLALGLPAEPWLNKDQIFAAATKEEIADARNYLLFWKKQIYQAGGDSSASAPAVMDILRALDHLRQAFDLVLVIEKGLAASQETGESNEK